MLRSPAGSGQIRRSCFLLYGLRLRDGVEMSSKLDVLFSTIHLPKHRYGTLAVTRVGFNASPPSSSVALQWTPPIPTHIPIAQHPRGFSGGHRRMRGPARAGHGSPFPSPPPRSPPGRGREQAPGRDGTGPRWGLGHFPPAPGRDGTGLRWGLGHLPPAPARRTATLSSPADVSGFGRGPAASLLPAGPPRARARGGRVLPPRLLPPGPGRPSAAWERAGGAEAGAGPWRREGRWPGQAPGGSGGRRRRGAAERRGGGARAGGPSSGAGSRGGAGQVPGGVRKGGGAGPGAERGWRGGG